MELPPSCTGWRQTNKIREKYSCYFDIFPFFGLACTQNLLWLNCHSRFFDKLSALPCKGEGRSRFGEKAIYTRGWLGMGYGPRFSQIVGTGSPPSLRRTKGTQWVMPFLFSSKVNSATNR